MHIDNLTTPCFLLNLDILERNIKKFQRLANANKTQLWPMLKTHKSTEITRMQVEAGAAGVLTGTIDEAEAVVEKVGVKKVMLAYPVLGKANIKRIIQLKKKAEVYIALDGEEGAREISQVLDSDEINYLLILDSGLGRFGVKADKVVPTIKMIDSYKNLKFSGICTHTGQVYGVSGKDKVDSIIEIELNSTKTAVENLKKSDYKCDIVATGTTPTFYEAIKAPHITVSRPGNYVFCDAIQVALGAATVEECSLTVMSTIVSHPTDDLFILDCGSKCLGLDKGAHGSSLVEGFGIVKDHPELMITGLSEEVAKVKINGQTNLKIGSKIEIIPNHSCSAANMTSYMIGYRDEKIERLIEVDIRGNSKKPRID
ncbi:alanine racemase [Psychrilyobacter sp.]|uniref:alanine racemase n=1 Tax=Psychrilyobacter sp. TaxID=2586924 RepID=UPI00301645A4